MAAQPENAGSPPPWSIPPETVREIGQFALRLASAGILVTALIQYSTPMLEVLIARGARNLLALVSSQYYFKTIEFIEGGYVFTSWIGPLRGSFKLPTLLFTFGFPISYALALSGASTLRYWRRLFTVVLISYFVCAIAVAIICDGRLTTSFMRFDIALQPEWRREFTQSVQYYMWMLTVRLYPVAMLLALALLSGQFRGQRSISRNPAVRALKWSVAGTLTVLLLATAGFDAAATARLTVVEKEPIHNRINGLEELNPDLGPGLAKLANWFIRNGNDRAALNVFRLATPLLKGPARADALSEQIFLREQIKEDMLRKKRRNRE